MVGARDKENDMAMYDRFAKDLSEELFRSVYADLFSMASDEQASIYNSAKGKSKSKKVPAGYHIGECQVMLNEFCSGKASYGEVTDFIKVRNAYKTGE